MKNIVKETETTVAITKENETKNVLKNFAKSKEKSKVKKESRSDMEKSKKLFPFKDRRKPKGMFLKGKTVR